MDTRAKPWLFARVFIWVMITYMGMYTGLSFFGNFNFLPVLIIVGSFMVPFTLVVFFWEMNAPQNIPVYKVVYTVFIGGVASLVAALVLYQTLHDFSGVLIVGFVEAAAKVLAIAWFLRNSKDTYILNGLLIGAAAGTGFADFETAGYALRVLLETSNLESLYDTILWCGIWHLEAISCGRHFPAQPSAWSKENGTGNGRCC
ncbi:PrsW family glutamic-type intramembrane protease [Paenibacillus sp. WQ 127069]|uniref:PrsW family glutamic-type intramembrane protease n=1 Tax=Paenibacillus baimaensis TaxID=2982185 RepID=A0ABT2UNQ8_9BACL|nr:PrsW family glutamic-type intramembrane protease [Paenibacillus sp. WQ 127069]MCU6796207.1 PrsW family glutamic-type intramembrane protease [Paenibacillus sp. WQ 127069]